VKSDTGCKSSRLLIGAIAGTRRC